MHKNIISILLLISTVSATAMEKEELPKDLQPQLKKKKIEEPLEERLVFGKKKPLPAVVGSYYWSRLSYEIQYKILDLAGKLMPRVYSQKIVEAQFPSSI